jgi:hypothetical protein
MDKFEFTKRLEAELRRRFMVGIGDICDADYEFEQRGDSTPEEIAKRLGDKYDLTDFEDEPWLR